jgi:hypothetical protein
MCVILKTALGSGFIPGLEVGERVRVEICRMRTLQ